MSDPHPLQAGDRSSDLSDYNFSNEADRRSPRPAVARSNPMNYHGEYPAADQSRPEGGRLWKVGQASPIEAHSAPFPVIQMDGDNTGYPAEVRELDILSYGDCYDPTAPMRVRQADNYNLDSDNDGHRN